MTRTFDIVIAGAGPAGSCAAIRLARLGYRIALLEQYSHTQPKVGDSLSPGVRNLFEFLEMAHLAEHPAYLTGVPTRSCWEDRGRSAYNPTSNNIIVDRSILDEAMIREAMRIGVTVLRPVAFLRFHAGEVTIRQENNISTLPTTIFLDARGRKGVTAAGRKCTAPPLLAIWTEGADTRLPQETGIEAVSDGWLWSSPLPHGRFRILALTDPASVKGRTTATLLHDLVAHSSLMTGFATWLPRNAHLIQSCAATPYYHMHPWEDNCVCLGETAFAFDPLSSAGMEKAMRFSLQAAIAINTWLRYQNPSLARTFYENRLREAVETHTLRTQMYYSRAWPYATDHPFWKSRAGVAVLPAAPANAGERDEAELSIDAAAVIRQVHQFRPRLAPDLFFSQEPAALDDHLELKTAVHHPSIDRQLIYLDQIELKPLLDMVNDSSSVAALLARWQSKMPLVRAGRLFAFLWSRNMLIKGD